jgi:putative peptidoglycan lipid II flippase
MGRVGRSAVFVGGQVLDRLCYAALLALMTYLFGVSAETDIYFSVMLVPMLLAALTTEASLVATMQFLSVQRDDAQRWAAIGRMSIFFFVIYFAISLTLTLAAPVIIGLVAFGFPAAAKLEATSLERLAAWLVLFNGLGSCFGAILMREGRVAWGVFRPAVSSVLTMATALGLSLGGARAGAFVAAMVIGAGVATLLLAVPLLRTKGSHRLFGNGWWRMRGLSALFASSFYTVVGNGTFQILFLVERTLASGFGAGFVTILALARTLLAMVSFVPAGVANALFVEASSLSWEQRSYDLAAIAATVTRTALFIALPFMIVYFVATDALVGVLFERGRFGAASTADVAEYALLLGLSAPYMALSSAIVRIAQLAHMNRALALGSNLAIVVYVAAAFSLTAIWGAKGLPLAAAAHGLTFVVLLYGIFIRRLGWAVLSAELPRQLTLAILCAVLVLALHTTRLWPVGYVASLIASASATTLFYLAGAYALDLSRFRSWANVEAGKIQHLIASKVP